MEHTPKRTSGKKCYKCKNNIGIDSSTFGDGVTVAHAHCLPPKARR